MAGNFCSNCGAQKAGDAAFCPSCGAPAQPAAAAQPPAYQTPPQQPYAAPPPAAPRQGGLSRNVIIGIAAAIVLVLVIGYFVRENEREFQRNRRAAQNPVAASNTQAPALPAPAGGSNPAQPYQGFNSGGEVGSPEWTRAQLIGRWGLRDCVTTTEFRADGTTFSTNGRQSLSGTWTYQHPRVTVAEPGGTTVLEIVQMGDLEMQTEAQGRQQNWRRCR